MCRFTVMLLSKYIWIPKSEDTNIFGLLYFFLKWKARKKQKTVENHFDVFFSKITDKIMLGGIIIESKRLNREEVMFNKICSAFYSVPLSTFHHRLAKSAIWSLVSCSRVLHQDQTTDLPINRWPALLPELQLSLKIATPFLISHVWLQHFSKQI